MTHYIFAAIFVFWFTSLAAAPAEAGDDAAKAGPDLLKQGGSRWVFEGGGQGRLERDDGGVGMQLSFPEGDTALGPDHHYMLGQTPPRATWTLEKPLDLSPWDIVVVEATQKPVPGPDADTARSTLAVRLFYNGDQSIFAFLAMHPGERSRQFVHLHWYKDFKPSHIERVMLHKLYLPYRDRYTLHRLRPAHAAILDLWAVQERLELITDRDGPGPPNLDPAAMGKRAATTEEAYWAGRLTGAQLEADVQGMLHELDAAELQRVRSMARDYAERENLRGFVTTRGNGMQRLPLAVSELQPDLGQTIEWSAAGNETESVQVGVVPLGEPLRNLTWSITDLHPISGDGAAVKATARLVGYVKTVEAIRYEPEGTNPTWRADPLLEWMTAVDELPADELQPLWISAAVPADAAPGEYQGTLTISADGLPEQRVTLTLNVWPFSLPAGPSIRTAYAVPSPRMVPVIGRDAVPQAVREAEDIMLLRYGMDPGNIYSPMPPTWDVDRLRTFVEAGLPGINLAFLKKPVAEIGSQLDAAEAYLTEVVDQVDGARELCYFYGYDEYNRGDARVVNAVAEHLAERFPGIPLMTTLRSTTFGSEFKDGGAIGIYVPRLDNFHDNRKNAPAARQEGRQVWYYTCVGPDAPFPNIFIDWPLIDTRVLLGTLAAAYRPDGFLYYAMCNWRNNVGTITKGPKTDWNPLAYQGTNGDGAFLYPGPEGVIPSLRLEALRDGMEDLAYYQLLRQRLAAAGRADDAAGEVSDTVFRSAVDYSRDPQDLANERRRLAEEIMKLR